MDQSKILGLLDRRGAVLTDGHFVYTSGRHGPSYINKDAIYPHVDDLSGLCKSIAGEFRHRAVQVVAAPAVGGVALAQWTAHHLVDALAVYAEPDADKVFTFRRGYDRLLAGRRVLVVEDVVTTGGSLRSVIAAVRAAGGDIIGVAALVNRGGVTAADVGSDAGLFSLVHIGMESFDPAGCPLCRQGIPIDTTVGKGREFPTNRDRLMAEGTTCPKPR